MKTILTTIFLLGLNTAFSQYNQDFDTSWTSLLQNSICTNVKFDEENNYYNSYIQFNTSSSEAGAIQKLQKRNANNQLLWEKPYRLSVIGFDYNNNMLCRKGAYNSGNGLYSTDGYIFRLNASNGNFIDSIAIDVGISIQKYQGDFLLYNAVLARYTNDFQLLWDFNATNPLGYEPFPLEDLSFIKNDTLFYVATSSSGSYSSLRFVKLATGFSGVMNSNVGFYSNGSLAGKSTINCNGIVLANCNNDVNTNNFGIHKVNGSSNTILIQGIRGFLMNVENQDEFLVVGYDINGQMKIARCNILGNTLSNVNLPTGFTLADMYIKKPIFYSNGYTYIFGKKNNHLCILTYDVALNLVNEFSDNADPSPYSYTNWSDFDANSSGCFVVAGSEFYGTKQNATLVKYCSADASINEETTSSFSLHPNPTSSQLFVTLTNQANVKEYTIYSVAGQKMFERKIETSTNSFQIEVEDFNPGVYFIQIGEHTEKFIIE
jgi:hypothetical protein